MMRIWACLFLGLGSLWAGDLPAWWTALSHLPRLESPFVQESESAVFGKLRREGTLRLAPGGCLRVEYRKGVVLVSNGKTLVQYDPEVRTAQRMDLRSAAADSPLINVLLSPATLGATFRILPGPTPGAVTLEPRKAGLPPVVLEGQGGFLKRIRWTDPTGAKQLLELRAPRLSSTADPALFTFTAPSGTRWLN
jgi:outer membrane lipoprotein-sorting protein